MTLTELFGAVTFSNISFNNKVTVETRRNVWKGEPHRDKSLRLALRAQVSSKASST